MNIIADGLSRSELNVISTVSLNEDLQNQIKRYYRNDEYCTSIMNQIQDDPESSNYFFDEDMLYKKPENILIVPRERQLIEKILYELHDCQLSAHQGVGKTFNNIKQIYCWQT